MDQSRRATLQLLGGAIAAAGLMRGTLAAAQVVDETKTDPLTIVRKGIDRELDVINVDLLEQDAKAL